MCYTAIRKGMSAPLSMQHVKGRCFLAMNHNLTEGAPRKVLFRFTLPLFGSMLLQQMYNIVDSLVAGKYIGKQALAAVSDSYEVTLIYLAFALGCNIGCSVVVSQYFGAGKKRDVKTAVSTTFLASGVLCILLMLGGFLAGGALLRAIDTPESVMADAQLYLNIYTGGLLPLFFYNISTGIFTALGDSKTPFWFLAASSFANIGMDILFVTVFEMGVAGVAWATFLCQTASSVCAMAALLLRLRRLGGERFSLFSFPIFRRIVSCAIPSVLQQSFISVGNILIQKAVNGYFTEEALSTAIMAGYGAAVKLNNLAVNCIMTVANGISNYTGQNIGANRFDRVKQGYRVSLGMGMCVSALFAALYLLVGNQLVGLFLDEGGAGALRIGRSFLLLVSPFYFIVALKMITDGLLRGAGAMRCFMISTLVDLVVRVVLAYILPQHFPSDTGAGIWVCWPIGWAIAAVVAVCFYRAGTWKTSLLVIEKEAAT